MIDGTAGELRAASWPAARLGEALVTVARHAGLEPRAVELPPPGRDSVADVAGRLAAAADWLGLEAEPASLRYGALGQDLRAVAPALLRLELAGETRFLAVLRSDRRKLVALTPEHRRRRLDPGTVRAALAGELETAVSAEIEDLLARAEVPARRRRRARELLLEQRLGERRLAGVWLLRAPASAPFRHQLRQAGVPAMALAMVVAHAIQHSLILGSWWVLGRGLLLGRLEPGWLLAWAFLLLSVTPFRALEFWSLARLTTRAGALLKRRLFAGVLRLEPDEVRHQGVGQLLGRVIDSEAFESLVLTGGHVGLIAGVELALALPILVAGAGGVAQALLLILWLLAALYLWGRFLAARRRFTAARLEMTHDLVERMVGHRTRLAQEPSGHWHQAEDQALAHYLELSAAMDRRAVLLKALVPRGWLLLGLAALAPPFVAGTASLATLAIGVGGVLFAYRALWKLVRGLADLAEAAVAWGNVAPLFRAAARPRSRLSPELALAAAASPDEPDRPVLEARELTFAYGEREPVLRGASLALGSGERVLLEGASGCGKSTLAAVLIGLRQPRSGLLFLRGLDRQSLGDEGWRRRVVAAPQFHENHVLTDTFAFNLLMGRGWPPSAGDLEEAEAVCRELGLGQVLARMPAGLLQMVGDSGWQLSHGEKSRLYVARALLQRADLVILDESFAALDPESLRQAMECVLRRAPALLVIAHP